MIRPGLFRCVCLAVLLAAGCAAAPKPVVAPLEADDFRVGEFLIGAGDKLEVIVYRQDNLERSMTVDPSGKIMFPLIGDLQAAGKSTFALRDEITRKLSRYLVNPAVTVEVTKILSRRMLVLGKVASPGYFVLETELTVLDALAKAGGPTTEANLSKVLLVRNSQGKKSETVLDLRRTMTGKDFSSNVAMLSGDILYVPSTLISDISTIAGRLSNILAPIVSLEGGIVLWPMVKETFQGKKSSSSISVGN